MGAMDNFCLRWNDYESNISSSFRELREAGELCDISLCCDNGKDVVQAHKVILAACSPLFRRILVNNRNQTNPFLYLKGIHKDELVSILNFMYYGEVSIPQESLNKFLSAAEELTIKGLTTDESGQKSHQKNSVPYYDDFASEDDWTAPRKKTPKKSSSKKGVAKRKTEAMLDSDQQMVEGGEDLDLKRIKAEPEPTGVDDSGHQDRGGDDFDNDDDFDSSFNQYSGGNHAEPGTSSGNQLKELEACSMSRTQRGQPFLLDVYGHAYVKNKEMADKTYWNCKYKSKFQCKACIHTDGLIVVYRSDKQHTHPPLPIQKNKYMDDVEPN